MWSHNTKNSLTGAFSCPKDYDAVLLLRGTATAPKTDKKCSYRKKCKFLFFGCRQEEFCEYYPSTETAQHQTYWCVPNRKKNKLRGYYLFGGILSNEIQNPITQANECPTHYISLKLGSQAQICVSEDYERGQQFALLFGGFFSCNIGNKLAANSTSDFLNNPQD